MNLDPINVSDDAELRGLLRAAVLQTRKKQAPPQAREQALQLALAKVHDEQASGFRRLPAMRWIAACASLAAILLIAVIIIMNMPQAKNAQQSAPPPLFGETPATSRAVAMGSRRPEVDGSMSFGVNARGIDTSKRAGVSAGASPSRYWAIASDTTVLVSSGGEQPIALGAAVASDMRQNVLHVWDWPKDNTSRPLKVSYAGTLAVSPDGKNIVTADGRIIDAADSSVKTIEPFPTNVRAMKFSPDGHLLLLQLATNQTAIAQLINFPSGQLICEIPHFWYYTFAAGFSADSKQVALMDDDRFIRRFDAATGKELAKYEPAHTNSVREILISDDGKLLASCASSVGEIRLWETQSGKLLHQFSVTDKPNGEKFVDSLALSHDGKLLAGGGHPLTLWDVQSGKRLHSYPMSSWGARYLRFSADDKTLTAISDFGGLTQGNQELLAYPAVQQFKVEGVPADAGR